MRVLMSAAGVKGVAELSVEVHEKVAEDLLNRKRRELGEVEDERGVRIRITPKADTHPEFLSLHATDDGGRAVKNLPALPSRGRK